MCFKATDDDLILTEKLWPIVRGIISTNIENDQDIIIEGCYIPTNWACDFESNYLLHIITLYIGFSKEYIQTNFMTGIIVHRSETEFKDVNSFMKPEYFIRANEQRKAHCEENDVVFFEIKEDYEKEMQVVYDWIDKQVEVKSHYNYNQ